MLASLRQWSASSRRLGALFLAVVVPSAATLVWLGVQLIEQDRRLWADRDRERRDASADIIVRTLEQKLAGVSAALTAGGDMPDGAVFAHFRATAITVRPSGRALWLPVAPRLAEADAQAFADGETAEFRQRGDRGLRAYTALSRAPDPAVQAGAVLRIARVYRSSGDADRATHAYRQLARFRGISINGMPADLVARRAICDLFEQTGQTTSLVREAGALRTEFLSGHWALDRSGWALAAEELERWTANPLEVSPEQRALTEALDWVWQQHRQWTDREEPTQPRAGRQIVRAEHLSILVQWRPVGDGLAILLVPPTLVSRWTREAVPPELIDNDALLITDESGAIVAGEKAESGSRFVMRLTAETGLPWNVALKPGLAPADNVFNSRRRLLTAGLGAIVILLSAGSYLLWRTVRRELALVRTQTDFVATVSHEFRTPLTSLRHVTELLQEDDDLPRERRQSLYGALERSTERLGSLVESLLDLARMEDGRRPYDLQPLDLSMLVKQVVGEFERHGPPDQTLITADLAPSETLRCRADAAGLGHALWNLLDNAVKYSPDPRPVRVSVDRRGDDVSIAVADHGFGIPSGERQHVFQKFVRGSDTIQRGIKGTGLGLAIVWHIVAAHGGRIELESEEGRGSIFTIVLPAVDDVTSGPVTDGRT